MNKKVSIFLTDKTWLEGTLKKENMIGAVLTDVHRSRNGESGEIPVGKKVFVPWSSILFVVLKEC